MDNQEKLIILKNIQKSYQTGKKNFYEALKGINLEIEKGEFVAIMGASGSGKSTLMNILGGLDVASKGEYFLKGKNIEEYKQNQLAEFRNKEVGFVFQRFNLLPRTSVYENVAIPGIYGDLKNLDNRVKEVLQIVGLVDKIRNKSNELSGGQVQRVAIARALLMKPSIIMADEPTGNLDSVTGNEIMREFVKINQQGNTVILITHEKEIAAYAKRIVLLKDGEIISDELNK